MTYATGIRRASEGVSVVELIDGALARLRAEADGDSALAALAPFARDAGFCAGALVCVGRETTHVSATFEDGAQTADHTALIALAQRAHARDGPVDDGGEAFAAPCHAEDATCWVLALAASAARPAPEDDERLTCIFAAAIGGAIERAALHAAAARSESGARDAAERLSFAAGAADMIVWDWNAATGAVMHTTWRAAPDNQTPSREAFIAMMHPEDRERVRAEFDRCVRLRASYSQDYRLVLPSGEVRWVMSRGRPTSGPNDPPRMSGVIIDITERRRAEAALARSERRFRAVFHEQVQFMALLDPAGIVTDVAESTLARAGLGRGDIVGAPLWEAPFWATPAFESDRRRIREAVAAALASPSPAPFEVGVRVADGAPARRASGAIKAVRDETGAVAFLIAQSSDTTEHARTRIAMARANAELTARVENEVRRREATQEALLRAHRLDALGHLAGGLAHDFNNLLAAVIGAFNLVQRGVTDERIKDFARQGVAAAQRGVQLVRQMRAFARRDALEVRPVDLTAHLADAAGIVQRALGADIVLNVDVAPDLWPAMTDTDQFDLALVNLAANARDAMNGHGTVTLRAENVPADRAPERIGPCVRVSLGDHGGGMSAEVLQRAVEPFFTTKEPGRASGLGLAMAHGFARQTGGALVLENRDDGLEASLYLPRARVSPEPAPLPSPAAAPLPGSVLLVDDDPDVRAVAAALLADLGVRVDVAGGAADARALYRPGRYDLVLTDVVMPGGDGPTLAANLRSLDSQARVVFMTGHTGDETRLDGEAVLHKPFSADDLADFLRTPR
ncbi:MAG: response regulator [Alphaproteobacteria bacterium]|nr:response regulator [Alphaproteobacteria bacterium]